MKKPVLIVACLCVLYLLASCVSLSPKTESGDALLGDLMKDIEDKMQEGAAPDDGESGGSAQQESGPAESHANSSETAELSVPADNIINSYMLSFIGKTNGELMAALGKDCETELVHGGTPTVYYTIGESWYSFAFEIEPGVNYVAYWPQDYDFTVIDNPYPEHCKITSMGSYYTEYLLQTDVPITYEYLCGIFSQNPELVFTENEMDGDSYSTKFVWREYVIYIGSQNDDLSNSYFDAMLAKD